MVPPLSSHAAHLCFFLWNDIVEGTYDFACNVILILRKQTKEATRSFFDEVIPAVIGSQNLVDVFCRALLTADIKAMTFCYTVNLISLARFSGARTDICDENRRELLSALAMAYQRNECIGDTKEGMTIAHNVLALLG